jgi:hypothetical protein
LRWTDGCGKATRDDWPRAQYLQSLAAVVMLRRLGSSFGKRAVRDGSCVTRMRCISLLLPELWLSATLAFHVARQRLLGRGLTELEACLGCYRLRGLRWPVDPSA